MKELYTIPELEIIHFTMNETVYTESAPGGDNDIDIPDIP